MKFFFFVYTEYPRLRDTLFVQELMKCNVRFFIDGRGVDLVVILIEDEKQEGCVLRELYASGIDYVFEMEGVPKMIKYITTRVGKTLAGFRFS
jgi:hypothetical protein